MALQLVRICTAKPGTPTLTPSRQAWVPIARSSLYVTHAMPWVNGSTTLSCSAKSAMKASTE